MPNSLNIKTESWPLTGEFRISRWVRKVSDVIVVEIIDGNYIGRGECFPYGRYGETLISVTEQVKSIQSTVEKGLSRETLLGILPPGAARNAVDCALWDLEAKRAGTRAWNLAGFSTLEPLTTVFTLGVDSPEKMGVKAMQNKHWPRLKLKMTGDGFDLERVNEIHNNAPHSTLVVDANEGWTIDQYLQYAPKMKELGVEMIEQPLPATNDDELSLIERPVSVCADESCHDSTTLDNLVGKYDMINIKLDKTGGLTEALRLKDAAINMGLEIMVGCMIGTSLAMAPGIIIGQKASIVDLDGPLLLAKDRTPGLNFKGSLVEPPQVELWG